MPPNEVKQQLQKILASTQFSHAERLSRFLRFVVEQSQSGSPSSLKEYSIGVEVFDRGKEFDPRVDPIVRTQAAKVRAKLLEYYAFEGSRDPIVISIPKGGYSPEIRARQPASPDSRHPELAPWRIAVLPFVNLSSEKEDEFFSDGLTEELINRLTCVPGLQVVARTSVFRFKGQSEDIREIGSRLGVGTILEGSVRKSAGQVRITAQLIDVSSGFHRFSRTYQREYKAIFDLQDELAQAVVDEITRSGVIPSRTALKKSRVADLEAYNHYLRGMYALSNRFADLRDSIDLFRKALVVDASYAPAWAGLAQAWWLLAWYYRVPADEAMPLAKEAALKTLEMDPDSAQGHASLGIVASGFEWDWTSSEKHFRRAIDLQPGLASIYPFFAAVCLLPQLRLDEACEMIERGTSLDPFNPLYRTIAAFIYGEAGRFEEALRHNAILAEISLHAPQALGSEGLIQEWRGDVNAAIPKYRRARELMGKLPHSFLLSFLGHALAIAGERAEAEDLLRQLLAFPLPPDLDIARIYLGLRDAEEALRWLESAAKKRTIHLLSVPADRRFDWLRPHPRFQDILRQMHLLS